MKQLIISFVLIYAASQLAPAAMAQQNSRPAEQPNILWIFQEDLSPWLGCYGHEIQAGHTPTIDSMASQGVRFSRAFVPAPVCSICRSAIITGAFQFRFGAHEHRSRRGKAELPLPEGMKTIPALLTEKGYFCFNIGKTDYNFEHANVYANVPKSLSKTPWRARKEGQPFFGQIQLRGGKLNTKKFQNKVDRSAVTIPADYPQNEVYREVVAQHYDAARMDDGFIAGILERLESDGLSDSTIVVYLSDHGANNLVRHKQQPTEGGSHVPFIIKGPDPWVPAPSVRDDLVSLLDLSATTLVWAGIDQPTWMEGQDLFGEKLVPREFVGTARDRCDQTIDRIRSVRTDRFRYTRNYMLDRVLLQPQYRDRKAYVKDLRTAYANGTLAPKLAQIYFGERPSEELYDIVKDSAQLNNLVDDPAFASELDRHRMLLEKWLSKGDTGAEDEPKIELEMASSDTWGHGVNSEYETIRQDSDGDGLSDKWESLNDRDPNDGELQFEFDCGGWQTEGWVAKGNVTNIAGSQGFLDFDLLDGKATLRRSGLKLDARKQTGPTRIRMRSLNAVKIKSSLNGNQVSRVELKADKNFQEITLFEFSVKELNLLELDFESKPGTTVTIDWIK